MSKKFVIGDRLKDEWISVLDTEKKKLEFTNHPGHREEEARVYQSPGYRQGVLERGGGPGEPSEASGDWLFQRPADLHEGGQQGLQD